MSAYITMLTPMTDRECLLAALTDLGFDHSKVEVHDTPVPLVGYAGDRREQVANIVIRRKHVGTSSNDVGFLATTMGYQASVSSFDQRIFGGAWLQKLNTKYQSRWGEKEARLAAEERRRIDEERQRLVEAQRQAVHQKAKKLGYRVEETREGDKIRMVLVKRAY